MKTPAFVAALALMFTLAAPLAAQQVTTLHPGKGGSPHVRASWTIDGANISIDYGRPALKGRTVGKDVAPAGQIWRTGADEATTLKVDKMLMFGSVHLAAGTYTLYTLPGEKAWQLVINKQTGQWGTVYDQAQDVARIPMTVGKAPAAAEALTISIDDTPAGATLHIDWGTTRASVNFSVM
jgi:hypothetical protein